MGLHRGSFREASPDSACAAVFLLPRARGGGCAGGGGRTARCDGLLHPSPAIVADGLVDPGSRLDALCHADAARLESPAMAERQLRRTARSVAVAPRAGGRVVSLARSA